MNCKTIYRDFYDLVWRLLLHSNELHLYMAKALPTLKSLNLTRDDNPNLHPNPLRINLPFLLEQKSESKSQIREKSDFMFSEELIRKSAKI